MRNFSLFVALSLATFVVSSSQMACSSDAGDPSEDDSSATSSNEEELRSGCSTFDTKCPCVGGRGFECNPFKWGPICRPPTSACRTQPKPPPVDPSQCPDTFDIKCTCVGDPGFVCRPFRFGPNCPSPTSACH